MAQSSESHILEPYLPHLDKRTYVHAMCSETVRKSKLLDAMDRAYKSGDLAKLKSSVQHVLLDSELSAHSETLHMVEVLREAGAQSIICENMYRKIEQEKLRPCDVPALENAVSSLEKLGLGPGIWEEPKGNGALYPKLPKVKDMLACKEHLHFLSDEFRSGSSQYCSAWLRAVEESQLTPKLETLTAKWFGAFPDSPQMLRKQLLEDDVRFSYDHVPWDERDKLIPAVREQLEELSISTADLNIRTTRSFGPEGGTVVVVTGPPDRLEIIRQVIETDGDHEGADFLDLGTDYDRDRARERAASLTLGDGEMTIKEPIERSSRRIFKPPKEADERTVAAKSVPGASEAEVSPPPPPPKPQQGPDERAVAAKSVPGASEAEALPPPPPPKPRQGPDITEDEFQLAKSAPPVQKASPPKDVNLQRSAGGMRGKMETAKQKEARIAKVLEQAGLSEVGAT